MQATKDKASTKVEILERPMGLHFPILSLLIALNELNVPIWRTAMLL